MIVREEVICLFLIFCTILYNGLPYSWRIWSKLLNASAIGTKFKRRVHKSGNLLTYRLRYSSQNQMAHNTAFMSLNILYIPRQDLGFLQITCPPSAPLASPSITDVISMKIWMQIQIEVVIYGVL